MLVGPRQVDADHIDGVVAATHGDRHSNLLVRQPAETRTHPRWEAHPVGLEDLVLAYLGETDDAPGVPMPGWWAPVHRARPGRAEPMLWVTWRQHRAELLGAALLLAVMAVPLIATGLVMRDAFHTDGLAACAADPGVRANCDDLVNGFLARFEDWGDQLIWVLLLPALAGVFIGAPLLGREFEHGTWRLAFTQSVTRTRWLVVKLVAVGLGVVAVAAAFTLLFTWWRAPLAAIEGSMRPGAFNLEGTNLSAAALFALAVGALAGVVWTFQLIESAIYVGLAVLLLGTAVWYLRRRTS